MFLKFWKELGVGITDVSLHPSFLTDVKQTLRDDMHTLKYVVIGRASISRNRKPFSDIDWMLSIADSARSYCLDQKDFEKACKYFLQCNRDSGHTAKGVLLSSCSKTRKRSIALPAPKVGSLYFRRDCRRKGFCKVIFLEGSYARVQWNSNGKITRIMTHNLRNRSLYSNKKVF